jgi:hypothetical protein
MLQAMKKKDDGGDAEQDEKEKQPAEPADRAHRRRSAWAER